MKLKTIINKLEELSPPSYAEEWDNVGLLLGDENQDIHHIMISLDASDYVIEQAVEQNVDLLLTHHPMIFQPLKQINNQSMIGRRIWKLATHEIHYYAMHTNFDIKGGMADLAAQRLGMLETQPLDITVAEGDVSLGIGKIGILPNPMDVEEVAHLVKEKFGLKNVTVYGATNRKVQRVAISPGSGKSEIGNAIQKGAEVLITGDIGHHEGIDAVDMGLSIIDATHYGLEHIFISFMEEYLKGCLEGEDMIITSLDTGSPVTVIC